MNGFDDAYLFSPDGQIQPTFSAAGGVFKDGMKFMNKAYGMGLLDPEMFTQKNTDFLAKNKNLQLLSVPSNWWNGDAYKSMLAQGIKDGGYYMIPGSTKTVWDSCNSPVAGALMDRSYTIAKKCQYPDRAMQLLDFLFSTKGNFLMRNGIQGKHWDMENGKTEYTDATLQAMKTDTQFAQKTGIGLYNNMCGLSGDSKDENENYLSLTYTEKAIKFNVTDADKDFCSHYSVNYPGQAYLKAQDEGKTKMAFFDNTWQGLMPDQSNDIKMIKGKVTNYVLPWVAKLIMSKTDNDFEKNWTKGVEDLNAMGYDQLIKWGDR